MSVYYIHFGGLSSILAALSVLFLNNAQETCSTAISDHVFSLFLWVPAGISLGGSVFINHYTAIFLVFAGQEVQLLSAMS